MIRKFVILSIPDTFPLAFSAFLIIFVSNPVYTTAPAIHFVLRNIAPRNNNYLEFNDIGLFYISILPSKLYNN